MAGWQIALILSGNRSSPISPYWCPSTGGAGAAQARGVALPSVSLDVSGADRSG